MLKLIVFSGSYAALDQVLDLDGVTCQRGGFTNLPSGTEGMLQAYVREGLLPTLAQLGAVREIGPVPGTPSLPPSGPAPLDLAYL